MHRDEGVLSGRQAGARDSVGASILNLPGAENFIQEQRRVKDAN
jgi:hypothetical protein